MIMFIAISVAMEIEFAHKMSTNVIITGHSLTLLWGVYIFMHQFILKFITFKWYIFFCSWHMTVWRVFEEVDEIDPNGQ